MAMFLILSKLKSNPNILDVLGDGQQRKSYLYVQDCIDAMLIATSKASNKVNIFNLGVDGYCRLYESIAFICNELGLSPDLRYSGGTRGWIGDNPFIHLDTQKIQSFGWKPKFSIEEGVLKTVRFLRDNDTVRIKEYS